MKDDHPSQRPAANFQSNGQLAQIGWILSSHFDLQEEVDDQLVRPFLELSHVPYGPSATAPLDNTPPSVTPLRLSGRIMLWLSRRDR